MINIGKFIEITLIQLVALFLLCLLILYLIKQYRLNRYERRLEAFSLFTNKDRGISFFDRVYLKINNTIEKIATILKGIPKIEKYSYKYEKYMTFEEKEKYSGHYYIAIKIMVSVVMGILCIITMAFQYSSFNIILFIFVIIFSCFIPDFYWIYENHKKVKKVEEDLLKAIIIMNNSFKSGNNITQAISIVKDELKGAIGDEFKKIEIDMDHGLSIDLAFDRFYERVKIEDAKYITSSLSLLNKTGGNIVKVFNLIEKTFFDKEKMRNELKSLTASSTFIYRLLLCLPILLTISILILNPSYYKPFFQSQIGMIVMFLISILYILYILVIKHVMKVKI